jgi:hypothetical protein
MVPYSRLQIFCASLDGLTWVQMYSCCVIVIGYIYVFGSSLLGEALLKIFIEDATFPSNLYSFSEQRNSAK